MAMTAKKYVGRRVQKAFDGVLYFGVVARVSNADPQDPWWFIQYDDGDSEDMGQEELKSVLLEDNAGGDTLKSKSARHGQRRAPRKAATPTKKTATPAKKAATPTNNRSCSPPAEGSKQVEVAAEAVSCAAKAANAVPMSEETAEERSLREEMGIKLGAVRLIHFPRPREVMLRHHADCCCWKCKEGIAPGKVKTGKRKAKQPPGGEKPAKAVDPVKAAQAALRMAQRSVEDCRCKVCRGIVEDAVTTPCGHSFCFSCLKGKADAQLAERQQTSVRPLRRAAVCSVAKLCCPKCHEDLRQWYRGADTPRNTGLQHRAPTVEEALQEAEKKAAEAARQQEDEKKRLEQLQEEGAAEEGLPLGTPQPAAEQPELEDVWDEEDDLPEDAILVGEKCKGKDGKEMGKDWRTKVWFEERQVGRVHLAPVFAKPEDVETPVWTKSFPPESPEEVKAAEEVERTRAVFRKAFEDAREALEEDHRTTGKVRDDGKRKSKRPDLAAQNTLRSKGLFIGQTEKNTAPPVRPGTLPGMPVGTKFETRAEMMVMGMHSHWLNGICSGKATRSSTASAGAPKAPCYVAAICMSGGYEDDQDGGEYSKYTGEGGNDLLHDGRQIFDQEWVRGNLSLAINCNLNIPVRVIRKNAEIHKVDDKKTITKNIFTYDGLYYVRRYWKEVGKSGYYTCKFQLERLQDQRSIATASVHWRNQSGKALPQTQRAEDRPGFIMADLSLGQETLPICVVNEIDRRSAAWAPDPIPLKPCLESGCDPVKDASWPSDPEERSRAFVYTTKQIFSSRITPPVPAPPMTERKIKALNGGSFPYNDLGRLHQAERLCVYEHPPEASAHLQPFLFPPPVCREGVEGREGFPASCRTRPHCRERPVLHGPLPPVLDGDR